jgi:hypothetical protein
MTKFATLFHRRMTALGGNLPGPGRGREGLELALSTFRPCQTAALEGQPSEAQRTPR